MRRSERPSNGLHVGRNSGDSSAQLAAPHTPNTPILRITPRQNSAQLISRRPRSRNPSALIIENALNGPSPGASSDRSLHLSRGGSTRSDPDQDSEGGDEPPLENEPTDDIAPQSGLRDNEDPVYGPRAGYESEGDAAPVPHANPMDEYEGDTGLMRGPAQGELRDVCRSLMSVAGRWTGISSAWLVAFFRMAGRHNIILENLAQQEGSKSRSMAHRVVHWGGLQVVRANKLIAIPRTAAELPNTADDKPGVLGAAANCAMDMITYLQKLLAGTVDEATFGGWATDAFWLTAMRLTWADVCDSEAIQVGIARGLTDAHAVRDLCCDAIIYVETQENFHLAWDCERDLREHVDWALAHATCDPCLRDTVDKKRMVGADLKSAYQNATKLTRLFFKRVMGIIEEWPAAARPLMADMFSILDQVIACCTPPERLQEAMAAANARVHAAVASGTDVPDNPYSMDDYSALLRDVWLSNMDELSALTRVVLVWQALSFADPEEYVAWATANGVPAETAAAHVTEKDFPTLPRLWLPDASFDYCLAAVLLYRLVLPHQHECSKHFNLPFTLLWELLMLRLDRRAPQTAAASSPVAVHRDTVAAITGTQRGVAATAAATRNYGNRSSQDSGHKALAVGLQKAVEGRTAIVERMEQMAEADREAAAADTERLLAGLGGIFDSFANRMLQGMSNLLSERVPPTATDSIEATPPCRRRQRSPSTDSSHQSSAAGDQRRQRRHK